MEFEWDEEKRAANLAKHGVDFADIVAFDFAEAVTGEDNRYDYGEMRLISYGNLNGRPHVVIYTLRGNTVRIISLRIANTREVTRHGHN